MRLIGPSKISSGWYTVRTRNTYYALLHCFTTLGINTGWLRIVRRYDHCTRSWHWYVPQRAVKLSSCRLCVHCSEETFFSQFSEQGERPYGSSARGVTAVSGIYQSISIRPSSVRRQAAAEYSDVRLD